MKFRYLIFTVCVTSLISCICFSQNSENTRYKFHWLTVENGLSNNRVTSITKGKNGYMWIGTDEGLNRFDGFNCKYYHAIIGDNYFDKLNQQITALFTDKQGDVWVGAYKLFKYNYQLDNIEPVFENEKTDQPTRVRTFYQSSDNMIWIGARNGLFSFSPQNKNWTHYPPIHGKLYFEIWDILVYNNMVWIATKENGLYVYNLKENKYSGIPLINDKDEKILELLCVYINDDGRIWVGTKNDGIFIIDAVAKKQLSHEIFDKKCRRIREIKKDKHGNYWVGTNEGLFVKNKGQSKFVKYTDENDFFSPISQNSVHTLYLDEHETIWLGTFAGGVCYADMDQKKFIPHLARNESTSFMNDRIVASIAEDKEGYLYLAVGTTGLNIYNKKTGQSSSFPLKPYTVDGTNIKCMAFDSQKTLWIGSYQGKITRFNPKTKVFKPFYTEKPDGQILQGEAIQSIAIDKDDNIWVGTDKGVNFIKKGSSKIENVFINNGACYVYIDRKGEIWTGVSGDGVFLWDEKHGIFRSCFQENNIATVNTLYRDANNHLWIGEKNGLSCIDLKDSSYHESANVSQAHNIQSILEDSKNNIWLGTSFGLVKCINAVVNIDSFKTRAYYKSDGLPSNSFWKNAAYKSTEGTFYFGSSNGFVEFIPDSIFDNKFIPNVNIVSLKISNNEIVINKEYSGKIILTKALSESDEISLSYRHKPFTIEFTALHFANPEGNLYAYMLYPMEKEWNYTKAPRNFATYYSIPGGKYTFRVKAANSDGIWNEIPTELKIKIVPPVWKTIWFLIVISIILFSLLIVVYYRRLYSIQLQREKLEKQVEDRTLEISLKNDDLELQKKQILAQSEELSLQKQDLEELNSMKDKMFSIIAHDLKNPFNSVIGFSQILLQKYSTLSEEKKLKYIQLIGESSGKIYRLLENLLIWSRAQINVLPFNPEEADLHELIIQNVKLSEADYWKKNINMIVNIPLPITVYCDINMMNSVIRNLITNAIKFTNNNGIIEISHKDHDKYTEIIVKDSGIGIDKVNIDKLFRVGNSLKKQGTSGEEGTGLGLLLCKEFVNKHFGEIWVESQKGKGSAFHFTLPKNNG